MIDPSQAKKKGKKKCSDSTEKKLIKVLEGHQDNSVDLICLGPLTNVANWLRVPTTENLMATKLKEIWIMGGNDVAENANVHRPEFNFKQDPSAANEVLTNSKIADKIRVVTEQISSPQNAPDGLFEFMKTKHGAGNGILSKVVHRWPEEIFFDPVCVFSYSNPGHIELRKVSFRIDPESGLLSSGKGDAKAQTNDHTVDFVTYVPIEGKNGLTSWINEAIEKDELQEQNDATS